MHATGVTGNNHAFSIALCISQCALRTLDLPDTKFSFYVVSNELYCHCLFASVTFNLSGRKLCMCKECHMHLYAWEIMAVCAGLYRFPVKGSFVIDGNFLLGQSSLNYEWNCE
jgi:hypothetical protein